MPFDTMTTHFLDITPVPPDVLKQHKQKMYRRHGGPSRRWRIYGLDRDMLGIQLAHVDRLHLWLPRRASAPRKVRRLALRVRDSIPDATFDLGYFYRDPYLMVHYNGTSHCLAIWKHCLWPVAIAKCRGD